MAPKVKSGQSVGVGKNLNKLLRDLSLDRTSLLYAVLALFSLGILLLYYVGNPVPNSQLMTEEKWQSTIPKLETLGPELQNGRIFNVLDNTLPPNTNNVRTEHPHGWVSRSPRPIAPVERILPGHSTFHVIETFPHNTDAFTQGLAFYEGRLYESTGLYGHSQLREIIVETGAVRRHAKLPTDHFGEGMVVVDDKVYVLTWRSGVVHIFDVKSFRRLGKLTLPTDGWGLTLDRETGELIVSDGSHRLTWYDRTTMEATRSVDVKKLSRSNDSNGSAQYVWSDVEELNELEYIHPYVYAHKWHYDDVYVIDPSNGVVVNVIDGSALWPAGSRRHPEASFNGIAVDYTLTRAADNESVATPASIPIQAMNDDTLVDVANNNLSRDLHGLMRDGHDQKFHLYVTGKMWPLMARVHIRHGTIAQRVAD